MQTVVLADFDSGNRRYRMKYLMYSYIYIYISYLPSAHPMRMPGTRNASQASGMMEKRWMDGRFGANDAHSRYT